MNKKVLAREIIIFFSAISVLVLISTYFIIKNEICDSKTDVIVVELNQTSHEIDSLNTLIADTVNYYNLKPKRTGLPLPYIPSPEEILHPEKITTVELKLFRIHHLLKYSHSKFDSVFLNNYETYGDSVKNELKSINQRKPLMENTYNFLFKEGYIESTTYLEFLNDFYQENNEKKYVHLNSKWMSLSSDLEKSKMCHISNEHMSNVIGRVSVLLFILLYILRGSFYLLRWAIKTLKN